MTAATDPYFNDVPWEFIFDDEGNLIGEVYLILEEKRRVRRHESTVPNHRPRLRQQEVGWSKAHRCADEVSPEVRALRA